MSTFFDEIRYIINNTDMSFKWPELVGLIFMITVIVIVCVKLKRMKSSQEELERQLSDLNAKEAVELNESTD